MKVPTTTCLGINNVLRATLILALVLSATPWAAAQSAKAKRDDGGLATAQGRKAKTPGGPQEGIKIRGHWVIEVRNPDGKLVTRREFENSLHPGGAHLLAQWLSRSSTPALWSIELGNYGQAGPCAGGTSTVGNPNQCLIVDSSATTRPTGTSVFPTLITALAGANTDQIVLTGNATALVQGQIDYVGTRQGACLNITAPADCTVAGTVQPFTFHDLKNAQGQPAPLSLTAGQIVQVKVTISFS